MLRCLHPSVTVPSPSTITRHLIRQRGVEEEKIRTKLPKEPQNVSLVLDCWSAPRRDGYIAIKAYWVNDEWKMAEALIGFESVDGCYTGEGLAKIVIDRLDYYGLSKRVIAIISDNASNNTTLAKAVNESI
jgi:hypothetical protein